jgi:hypothetical protein
VHIQNSVRDSDEKTGTVDAKFRAAEKGARKVY